MRYLLSREESMVQDSGIQQVASGVLRTAGGIHYFSGSKIKQALERHGITGDAATQIIGEMVADAILAENRPEGR